MSKFKVGDCVEIVCTKKEMFEINGYIGRLDMGHVGRVTDRNTFGSFKVDHESCWIRPECLKPAKDCSSYHPHHDVIVAWAKGAKIRGRAAGEYEWEHTWVAHDDVAPGWRHEWEYEVIPEPDHTKEIAEIERKMRALSEVQNELADRLEGLR